MKRFGGPASLERLAFLPEQFQVDDQSGTVVGIAAVFGSLIDTWTPTVIERGAFTKTLQDKKPEQVPFLWQHNVEEVMGYHTELHETELGLEIRAKVVPTGTNQERLQLMKAGAVRALSIGFDPIRYEFEERGELPTLRHLHEVRLWETSAVTFGADPAAHIIDVQSVVPFQDLPLAARAYAWDPAAAEARVRAWAQVDERPTPNYRRSYVWADPDSADSFEGFALPIADVIDGQLRAVPRAIFAAAATVQGARAGVTIPVHEVARVKTHLSRYFAKMAQMFHDDAILAPWDPTVQRLATLDLWGAAICPWAIGSDLAAMRELSEGKVLSAKNKQLLQDAVTALQALLTAAEPPEDQQALTAMAGRLQRLRAAELSGASLVL